MRPFAITFLLSSIAIAKPITDACKGCVASAPVGDEPAPLLVLLHGDNGDAKSMHAAWEKFASARNIALLSLPCPPDLGCTNSFWAWNGEPSWITDRIESFSKRRAIDRDRMWIAGWSGGASYIGLRTRELEQTFAAIVLWGGGIPPASDACSEDKPPVFFLSGDQNPLQHLALQLRDHYTRCGNEVSFRLVKGADHHKEWNALETHGSEIADALLAKRKVRVVAVAPPVASTIVTSAPIEPSPLPKKSSSCSCTVGESIDARYAWMIATCAIAITARRRSASAKAPRTMSS